MFRKCTGIVSNPLLDMVWLINLMLGLRPRHLSREMFGQWLWGWWVMVGKLYVGIFRARNGQLSLVTGNIIWTSAGNIRTRLFSSYFLYTHPRACRPPSAAFARTSRQTRPWPRPENTPKWMSLKYESAAWRMRGLMREKQMSTTLETRIACLSGRNLQLSRNLFF